MLTRKGSIRILKMFTLMKRRPVHSDEKKASAVNKDTKK
jgi:hypothetical protein